MAWLAALLVSLLLPCASSQGYGGDLPVPNPVCADGVDYVSELGPIRTPACVIADLDEVTSDECGRACVADAGCACATHALGSCSLLSEACCEADVLRPCRGEVADQSRQFQYAPNGLQGRAVTTRYWDCAKPSCGWYGKARVSNPVRSCRKNGFTIANPSEQSGASAGGTAFACSGQQPWVSTHDPNLSFGFGAFNAPQGESRACCICLELSFLDPRLAGKRHVIQVTNLNGGPAAMRPGQHIDLAVPGGGIGAVNACKAQWNAGASWGQLFGGLGPNRWECDGLPEQLRRGCRWQYDFLLDVKSDVQYREIVCPAALLRATGCKRL